MADRPGTLDDTLSLSAERLHDRLCDQFENDMENDRSPRIEEILAQVPPNERAALFEKLFRIEAELRPNAVAYRAEYRARFPDFAEQVNAILDNPQGQEFVLAGGSNHVADPPSNGKHDPSPMPERIGRYRIERILGEGGFGVVYLAYDADLYRRVAIKVPHRKHVSRVEDAQPYLTEARTVAALDHPNIVTVFDVGATDEFPCFVVSKYIEGCTLADMIATREPLVCLAPELVATVAETLHYAHRQGLVHRDVKPSNILIDQDGKPYVADFGLALREENVGRGPRYAGTPSYMSPEQARGEGHRVDGRSDIFSLGVMLYEMLTWRRPFDGESRDDTLERIVSLEPRPPRQIVNDIPRELERICLKALSKRASERYTTARDMADDLRFSPSTFPPKPPTTTDRETDTDVEPPPPPPSSEQPVRIVPKGLRSFDAGDANFFLELLPGPRDRDGLPESIRFWKTRIEEPDADETFAVGLIYGPSGCGKSSLVKAGLLPRLNSNRVIHAYVEASGADTETRLLKNLRKRCPGLSDSWNLVRTFAALRKRQGITPGKKLLIVLDQFEQWLHANKNAENPELVQALRHCDGGNVQCIVMVRDDFWLAVTRFMRELEIDLVPDKNIAVVDLFDLKHAEKVLSAFGRAYGKLPEGVGEKSKEQREFLKQAVAGLAQDNNVICVRLALFADMFEHREWTPAALKQVGGAQGVGLAFLEETFSSRTANPKHLLHKKAIPAVLKELLPEAGEDIKGHMRSYDELLKASGYANRPKEFAELIQILDSETRLITPTDPDGADTGEGRADTQVNRDAESSERSAERIDAEAAQPSGYYQLTHDYLVHSLRDWLNRKERETLPGRARLKLAERSQLWNAKPQTHHLPTVDEWAKIRIFTRGKDWTQPQRKMMRSADRHYLAWCVGALVCLAILGWAGWEYRAQMKARSYADNVLNKTEIAKFPDLLDEMKPWRDRVEPMLRAKLADPSLTEDEKLRINLAFVGWNSNAADMKFLYEQLVTAKPQDFAAIRTILAPEKELLTKQLWDEIQRPDGNGAQRFRAACAVVEYFERGDPRWNKCSDLVVAGMLGQSPIDLHYWRDALWPMRNDLLEPLAEAIEDSKRTREEFRAIIGIYRDFAHDSADGLNALKRRLPMDAGDFKNSDEARRRATVAAALAALGETDRVWPLLRHTPNPTLRSYLIERLAMMLEEPKPLQDLKDRLDSESNVSIRRALILTIGSLPDRMPEMEGPLLKLYENDPDCGIHGATRWVLQRWGKTKEMAEIDKRHASGQCEDGRNWYVNHQMQTFSVIVGKREWWLPHRYAISTTEVTRAQFEAFPFKKKTFKVDTDASPDENCPVNSVEWYDAAAYCNWLSEVNGIPKSQWCYEIKKGRLEFVNDYQSRTGYRLHTETEWEFACLAGAKTPWHFGEADNELVSYYAWWRGNAHKNGVARCFQVALLKPNDFGLFDMHGNVNELCQEPLSIRPRAFAGNTQAWFRGGSYGSTYNDLSIDFGGISTRVTKSPGIGFRIVRTMY